MRSQRGFTLLEVLVATVIMGIAVAGVLSGLAASARNASKLTQYDRATLLARQKMDQLLVDDSMRRGSQAQGTWDEASAGGVPAGWRAAVQAFETAPGAGPGNWVLDRIELEVWWMDGATRRSLTLEGFRRGILRVEDKIDAPR
jgi:general secretion pathway protein I